MNNFTQNGNGASVEITACYESGISQHYFNENFEKLDNNSQKWYFKDWGNVETRELSEMYIVTDNTREKAIQEMLSDNKYTKTELKTMTNDELTNEFRNFYSFNYYDFDDKDFFEFDNVNYGKIDTRGYSQGDFAEVYYSKTDLEKARGSEPREQQIKETVHNLFWDCPLDVRVNVDGMEYLNSDSIGEYASFEDTRKEMLKNMKPELTEEQYNETEKLFMQVEPTYL